LNDLHYPDSKALWLVTGAAGFIGSNIVERLLREGQRVRALDNFATGFRANIDDVSRFATTRGQLDFVEGDIRDLKTCEAAVSGVTYVLHQAGLGSVPRSLANPIATNEVNVTGFLNMLDSARRANVKSFVYAASSSTYGDAVALPKIENRIGSPLSPYAVTKLVNEIYSGVFYKSYGFASTGLRYFNVFGPRQDPDGAYAAVIPRWTAAMINNKDITINGDGQTSRDFCFVDNAVQANIKAALADTVAKPEVYNVAVGDRTTLNSLVRMLKAALATHQIHYSREPVYTDFRAGDVRHSQADISKAASLLGYAPTHTVEQGIAEAMPWYIDYFRSRSLESQKT
jgi:UDP-N-acetylglucosamine/UDP-N-acetylgalactosamine 4-epimerase